MYYEQIQNILKRKIDCLYDNLVSSRAGISSLMYRITHIKSENKEGSDIDSKFLMMLARLEEHTFDEKKLMREIEAMEKQHADMKEWNLLKTAEKERAPGLEEEHEKEKRGVSFEKLLLLWLLFRSRRALFSFGKA